MTGQGLSLRLGLPLALVLYTAIAGLLTLVLTTHRADQRMMATQQAQVVRQLHALQGNLAVQLRQGAIEEAQRQIVDASVAPEVELVALVDDTQHIIVASRNAWRGHALADQAPHLPPESGVSAQPHRQVEIHHDTVRDHLTAHTWVDLPGADPLRPEQGTLFIVHDLTALRAAERSVAMGAATAYGALMVLFAVALAWGLRRWLATRIDALTAAANALAAGDLSARAGLGHGDEFAQLGASFDAMAEQIARSTKDQRRLVAALEQSSDGMVVTDSTGHAVYANKAWGALTGLATEEVIGRTMPQLLPAAAEGPLFRLRGSGGDEALVQYTCTPLVDVDGEAEGTTVVLRDQTELSRLQDQLTQAQKMEAIGQLAGGIAHDFNNLLTVILGNAQMATPQPEDASLIHEIIEASERAAEITGQLLAFSRQGPVRVANLCLHDVVDRVRPLLERLLPSHITLAYELEEVPPVSADRTQLEQVLLNLAVNARDAMPDGGTITLRLGVRTARIGSRLVPCASLWVIDDGPGMDEATARRVFEPFFTTKGIDKGTGLGLAMAHGIVKRFGGAIHLHTAPGAGCRFELDLPLVEGAVLPADGAPLRVAPRQVGSVLLCEDSAPVRALITKLLRRSGIRVTATASPTEALEAAAGDGDYQVLVTDVVMPQMDGISLARAVREHRPDIAVVIVSGYPRDYLSARGIDELDAVVLAKPFRGDTLQAAVLEATAQRSGRVGRG